MELKNKDRDFEFKYRLNLAMWKLSNYPIRLSQLEWCSSKRILELTASKKAHYTSYRNVLNRSLSLGFVKKKIEKRRAYYKLTSAGLHHILSRELWKKIKMPLDIPTNLESDLKSLKNQGAKIPLE